MSQTTKVTIEYNRVGNAQSIYTVWVHGGYFARFTLLGVKTLLTGLGLRAGKRVDAACKEARETGRAEFEI
jgi:hypothetical protein